MKLSDQVTSLEISKRLKELGVKQEYQPYDAYWVKISSGWRLFFLSEQEDPPTQTPYELCRAFTVAELGEIMKPYLRATKELPSQFTVNTTKEAADNIFSTSWWGKLLIYLLENKLI